MQTFSTNFQSALNADPRVLVDVYEFYASTYVPPTNSGFDPADALEKFSGESLTWNGLAYRREVISRGDITRSMGAEQNSVSITFSNVSRYMATLAQSGSMEGLFLVVRTIAQLSGSFVTDGSAVLFVGRASKPSTIDKKTFFLDGRQDFGGINQELPHDKFIADDPNGVQPGNVLFEGFRFHAITGTFQYDSKVPSTSLLGALLGRKKKVHNSQQYSSLDNTPYGDPVPEVFGSCQMQGIPIAFFDSGYWLQGLWVWCKGPITSIDNLVMKDQGFFGLYDVQHHLGTLGGTGDAIVRNGLVPQVGGNVTEDFRFPGSGLFSRTAFSGVSILQGATNGPTIIDTPPTMVALIRGREVDLPDSDGIYNQSGWTDNLVHIARFIFTNPRFGNIDPGFMEDSINYQTSLHCDGPVVDDSEDQIIVVAAPDLADAGSSFQRYRSTGLYTPRYFLYNAFGVTTIIPEVVDGPYTSFAAPTFPDDPASCPIGQHRDELTGECVDNVPGATVINAHQPMLRKRYTGNFPITEVTRLSDLLYKTVFPAAKLFTRVTKNGKIAILSEQPSDSTRVRAATAVGDTAVKVTDVQPWKTGPGLLNGRLLVGMSLATSEVRDVSSATYSADGNSITLTASATGTSTSTASGATLSGGSTSVRASGTVTIGGTPAAGNIISATINGLKVSYILSAEDTNGTAAAMLATYIQAIPRLNGFVEATWDSGTPLVITLQAKYGVLNLSSPLLKVHATGVADPTTAPTVAAAGSGALDAGTALVAYTNVTALGETSPTQIASVVLTANQQIAVSSLPSFPTGVTSRRFFISEAPDSRKLRFAVERVNASDFNINALPLANAAQLPISNTTAEEIVRVAMSFATNSQDVLPAWKAGITVILNDIYLPDALNGHKYKATSITTGITGSSAPTWPTSAGGTVVDTGVTWTEFGETVLGQTGLTRANVIKDSYNWPLGSEQSSINQIKISYRDRKNDFALTPFQVNDADHQLQVGKPMPYEVDGSAIDSFNQMNRIANWLLAKYREGDWFVTLGTGPQGLCLEEGDVICSSDDSGGLINEPTRIEQLSISPNHEVTIGRSRLYSTNMFSDDAEKHTIPIPTTLRFVGIADSVIEFVDSFAIRDSDALVPGFYVAVSRDLAVQGEWRGWILYADYGDGYKEIKRGDIPAIMGMADTILGTVADPAAFDTAQTFTANSGTDILTCTGNQFANGNSVRVSNSGGALPAPLVAGTVYFVRDKSGSTFKLAASSGGAAINLSTNGTGTNSVRNVLRFTLKYGPPAPAPNAFANATEAELTANPYRNLFIYGNEYLQAGTIVDNGDQSFIVSDFLRGRFDTDATDFLSHGAAQRIVFLNGAEQFIAIDPSRVGIPYNYKAVTVNQDVTDASPVSFTWTGGTARPPEPSDLDAVRDTSKDWYVSAIGHPKPWQTPAAYVARIRKVSDGSLLRDLPIAAGTYRQAAMFNNAAGPITITNNNLYGSTGLVSAEGIQQILTEGMQITFKLTVPASGDAVSFYLEADGPLGFGPACGIDSAVWVDANTTAFTGLENFDTVIGPTDISTVDGVSYVLIALVGTEIRIYASTSGIPVPGTSKAIFIGKEVSTLFPATIKVFLTNGAKVENIWIAGLTDPRTIYALRQQQADLGEDGTGTGSSTIDVEMWQTTPYVGINGFSVRGVF